MSMTAGTPVAPAPTTIAHEHLERALAGDGLRPVFQPIVDLKRRVVVGYEALTRFSIADAPSVGPDRWFHAARVHGVGPELEAAAIRAALRHRSTLPRSCFLSVNLDPNHLTSRPITEVFAQQRDLGGLVIEFTEHRAWESDELVHTADLLRFRGAVLAIDDAGAGHSGLRQILRLRPSILKLDRALIEGIDDDEAKVALVEMLGTFATRIDAWILAEGVETAAEARRLVQLRVPLAQGYLFARPAEPWAGVDDETVADMPQFDDDHRPTLHRLTDPAPPLRGIADAVDLGPADRWHAVVDHDRRPVGVVDTLGGGSGEVLPALVANVHTDPSELAARLSTAAVDPSLPAVVTDDGGRYLGLVTLRRLLAEFARPDPIPS